MKRFLAGITAGLLAVILIFSVEGISAESYYLMDGNTGAVISSQNAQKRHLIASTTKIMTALVISEQCNVLDRVRIPKEAVGIEGSSMYLQVGEVLTVQELLYGLMLRSGNDAATALAIYCGGTVEGFAQLMNDKAHILGLKNTHFENPHGLDSPNHYSTAEDMATLAAYAMNNPIFAATVSTKTVTVGNRILQNHNKLLWTVEGADGVKTGYTKAAGRILVSSAKRNNRRLIVVTMNDGNDWQDHATLLDSGFARFQESILVSEGQALGTVEIAGGTCGQVELIAGSDFCYYIAPEEDVQIVLPKNEFVYAPVVRGQDAGIAHIFVEGNVVGHVDLIYGTTIERDQEPEKTRWRLRRGGSL